MDYLTWFVLVILAHEIERVYDSLETFVSNNIPDASAVCSEILTMNIMNFSYNLETERAIAFVRGWIFPSRRFVKVSFIRN